MDVNHGWPMDAPRERMGSDLDVFIVGPWMLCVDVVMVGPWMLCGNG